MKYQDFWDLHTMVMSKIEMAYVSTEPSATKNAVAGALDVLDKIGALNWPLNKEVANVCPKCGGKWRTDGLHQNEFCEKCFASKPGNAEL